MPTKFHPKLSARYYGPYLVLEQFGAMAFQLQVLERARLHPVFSQSKTQHGIMQLKWIFQPSFKQH